jgi:hypothetical protein
VAGASGKVTYADAYRAVKVRRRAELASLQKVATDNNPFSRFLLGTFFLGFAGMMLLMFPPLSAVRERGEAVPGSHARAADGGG